MIDLTNYLHFLTDNNLNQEEFLLLFCIYRLKYCDTVTKKLTNKAMKAYTSKFGVKEDGVVKMTTKAVKEALVNKHYLSITGNGVTGKEMHLTEKAKKLFANPFIAGNDFVNAYPSRALIDGIQIPLKTGDRVVMTKLYTSRIRHSMKEHLEVMKDLEYAKDRGLINMSLENFIRSEQWHDLRIERREHQAPIKVDKHIFDQDV